MKPDRDTYDDKHRATDPAPLDTDDLFGPAYAADGGTTEFTRQAPNGRFTERDPPATNFGVDRDGSGRFASRDRDPVPQIRDDDGTLGPDPFGVGNDGAFDDDYDWGDDL